MFSKGNKNKSSQPSNAPSAPKKRVPPSIVSADMVITGNLVSEGEVQIDGTVKGDIRSQNLLVGEGALIQGEITADNLRVHGKVDGQIRALNVSLAKTAHVVGDILHDNLSIETGAFLEGHCKRLANGEFKRACEAVTPAPAKDEPVSKNAAPAAKISTTAHPTKKVSA